MSELGSDFDCPGDLRPDMRLLSTPSEQITAWLQALASRLQIARGAVWFDLDCGLDMRTYVSDTEQPEVAAHEINQELLKDERTTKAVTQITVLANGSWNVVTSVQYLAGQTYQLTFLADASQVELLNSSPRST